MPRYSAIAKFLAYLGVPAYSPAYSLAYSLAYFKRDYIGIISNYREPYNIVLLDAVSLKDAKLRKIVKVRRRSYLANL